MATILPGAIPLTAMAVLMELAREKQGLLALTVPDPMAYDDTREADRTGLAAFSSVVFASLGQDMMEGAGRKQSVILVRQQRFTAAPVLRRL